ncbi:MAG TPA: hypothetical protein VGW98_12510 [Solirubrobacteraceae bacterium]|jgi:hypothetical protein|nr:hypothetical protein [Solirubrobacteraceae bacterium]
MDGISKPLRTATYLLRFTPEEKAVLEQRVREAAAAGKVQVTLADALRGGAELYLDDLQRKFAAKEGGGDVVTER